MNTPLITVVIPAYNSAATIRACLDSVTVQSFAEVETIVVDGLSKDETVRIVQEVAARYPAVQVISEKDNGIYDAINKGVRRAKGEWVYVLGSDDKLHNAGTLAAVAEKLRQSDAGVVYGDVLVRGDAGWAKDGEVHDGEFTLEKLLKRNICQQAVFYRRSLFSRLGYFNTDYPICADWDFMLCCAAKSKLEYVDLIIAEFSGGGASGTAKEVKFYEELPGNLFAYFGLRIFGKAFKPVGWRFRKAAVVADKERRKFRALLFRLAASKHDA